MNQTHMNEMDCVVVGGGPGGAILSLLLAHQGVRVLLLEAHQDFERDYRGDTVHPSTVSLLEQLGLLEGMLALPHTAGYDFPMHFPDGRISPPRTRKGHPTYAVRQAQLLNLLVAEAKRFPTFGLEMGARVESLIIEEGIVRGVRYLSADGEHEVRAGLVVGADGRFSKIRQLADLTLQNTVESIDLLWLRLPKRSSDPERGYGLYNGVRHVLVVSNRGDHWQVGLILPKGGYPQLRERGIEAVREAIDETASWLADRTDSIVDWRETSLLNVQAGMVKRWYRQGLLLIGDAAHVMSPVFGVGINYAVQDAVVAANVLGPRLLSHALRVEDLASVQRERELPTRLMQIAQRMARPRLQQDGRTNGRPWQALPMLIWPFSVLIDRLVTLGGFGAERFAPRYEPQPSLSRAAAGALQAFSPLGAWYFIGAWPPMGQAPDEQQ